MPTHWLLKNLSPPHFLSFFEDGGNILSSHADFLSASASVHFPRRNEFRNPKRPCGRIAIYDHFDGILCCKLFIHSELKRMVFGLKLNGRNTRSEYTQKILLGWSHHFLRRISARNEKIFFVPKLCRGTMLWRKTSRRKNLEIFWMNSKTIIESGFSDVVKNYFYMSSDSFDLLGGNILHNPESTVWKDWCGFECLKGRAGLMNG